MSYHVVSVGKLSETQKSKLRNGHSTRIKKGSGNQLHLTSEQLKKLEQAHAKGRAYTITLNPEQSEKHGQGIFGDIFSKAKKLAIKNKDLINPIISSVKSGASKGVAKLAKSAQDKIDKNIKEIEGEGIVGDALKGLISMSGIGLIPKRKRGPKKGKGIFGSIVKAVAPMVIDAVAGAAKSKVSGTGTKKAGRPRKNGGALYAPGVTGSGAKKAGRPRKRTGSKGGTGIVELIKI